MTDTTPAPPETEYQTWPVCPHCGHIHSDAWEWYLGPCLEGSGDRECESCGQPFHVVRDMTIYYTTTKP